MTLTQGQSHQIHHDDVDPKQVYTHAKLDLALMVSEKRSALQSFSNEEVCK